MPTPRAARWLLVGGLTISAACSTGTSDQSRDRVDDPVEIEWLIGFGTGARPEQIAVQEAAVTAFNAAHDDIELVMTVLTHEATPAVYRTRVEAGDASDIVGPLGWVNYLSHMDTFRPIGRDEFDFSAYDPVHLARYEVDDRTQRGVSIGSYPQMLFVRPLLFEDAGLPLPPATVGERYNGQTWDFDALAALARTLTIDSAGRNADDPGFDPTQVVQFGLDGWKTNPRTTGAVFGDGSLIDGDGNATIPSVWIEAWKFWHTAIHVDQSVPDAVERNSLLLGRGESFRHGNVAMSTEHLWYAPSLIEPDMPADFDLAVLPAHRGRTTSRVHHDSFQITAGSPHPEQALIVLEYLLNTADDTIVRSYEPVPARQDLAAGLPADLQRRYGGDIRWDVVVESAQHPDAGGADTVVPNQLAVTEVLVAFMERLASDPAFDVDGEATMLRDELDRLFRAES